MGNHSLSCFTVVVVVVAAAAAFVGAVVADKFVAVAVKFQMTLSEFN